MGVLIADPLSDMLARIRNALMARKERVEMPYSRLKAEVARVLTEEGFVRGWRVEPAEPVARLVVELKYGPGREPAIAGLKPVSKPGRRVYARVEELPRVMAGLGVAILSTSRGIMTDRQARRERVGGEVLCYVW
jgi:small subunit ribosomal protein S8